MVGIRRAASLDIVAIYYLIQSDTGVCVLKGNIS